MTTAPSTFTVYCLSTGRHATRPLTYNRAVEAAYAYDINYRSDPDHPNGAPGPFVFIPGGPLANDRHESET